jgi:predicted dehydrogenase
MKLRVAVVGVGEISVESHLPVLKSLGSVELVAVCDRQLPIAKDVAAEFGISRVYGDLGDMLLEHASLLLIRFLCVNFCLSC